MFQRRRHSMHCNLHTQHTLVYISIFGSKGRPTAQFCEAEFSFLRQSGDVICKVMGRMLENIQRVDMQCTAALIYDL
jgi:hypothetical protein